MKYIIIEDEFLAAQALEKKVKDKRPKWHCVAKLESVMEAVEFLENTADYDLIFCDIHLSDGKSFEIFEQVEISLPVIFTTAFDQYAIKAFKLHSIHYLLKPIKEEQLEEAIEKFEAQNKTVEETVTKENRLQALLEASSEKAKSRFLVKKGQNMRVISKEEVAYFFSTGGITYLIDNEGKSYLMNETLDHLESEIGDKDFFRASRQYIIHIDAIIEIEPYFKGKLFVHLQPAQKEECVISQAKAREFKEWINEK